MNPLIAAAAHGAEGGDEISPILAPYPGLMFWTIVTFFLAMWVLKRYAFGPIQEALDRRRDTVNGAIEQAEQVRSDAERLLVEYKAQLAAARTEAEGIVDRARKAGDELTARIKTEAEEQRREQLHQTQTQVQAEVERSMTQLRQSVADMTMLAAEKVLRGALDPSAHQRLVEQAVDELDFSQLQKVGAAQ
jgi:F-type H+-transporting ATPase subunit b